MKQKFFALFTVLALLVALVGVASPAKAAAYPTSFTTYITYQNVGTDPATILLDFYAAGSSTPITIDTLPELAPNAGTSLFVGSLSQVTTGFKGSAVMSSDQPLVATLVQGPPNTSVVKGRPLSNGFSAGSDKVLIPTVLKSYYNITSIVSIQNVDTVNNDLTVEFVPLGGTPWTVTVDNLPSGSAKYYDMGTYVDSNLGSNFNGSMRVTAVKDGTTTPGAIVATTLELSHVDNNWVYAWEGINQVASTIYMPSALCRFWGGQNSFYAVQNVGTSPINIRVTYSNGNFEDFNNVPGGEKRTIKGCGESGTLNPDYFIGSATITATGNIAGIAKIQGWTVSTAFSAFTTGSRYIALPIVRWTETHWEDGTRMRTYLAIQNIGAPLAADSVKVHYFDKSGNPMGVHSLGALATGAKLNSKAIDASASNTEFGYYTDGTYGGSVIIEGPVGSQLVAIARNQNYTTGEDYSGQPIVSFTAP